MASLSTTTSVNTAQALLAGSARPDQDALDFFTRLRRARLGLITALIAVAMIFVSYSSAYIVRQGLPTLDPSTGTLVRDWLPLQLPRFLWINTLLLLASSFTMELARRQSIREAIQATQSMLGVPLAKKAERRPWLALTSILGFSFLCGQWLNWSGLAASGFHLATSPSSSFFYLLTGMHGIHLLGGWFAMPVADDTWFSRRISMQSRGVIVDISGWYWHFMTFLWVYILCLLEFAR